MCPQTIAGTQPGVSSNEQTSEATARAEITDGSDVGAAGRELDKLAGAGRGAGEGTVSGF